MKACSDCATEFDEAFKFCPECGRPFGGDGAVELKRQMDQHLLDMKHRASSEDALSRRVFAGQGLGDRNVGPVYGGGNASL